MTNTFRGARASLDRPFASPGDVIEVRLSPYCDAERTFDARADRNLVSVIFTPPEGPPNIVVLATDCSGIDPRLEECRSRSGAASVNCVPATASAGTAGIRVIDAQRLQFPFPDSDELFDGPRDGRTFTGPATIAVTRSEDQLPCELASTSCAAHDAAIACVDALYAIDGSCGTTLDSMFGHFTALPPPNNYQDLCVSPAPPCTGRASELRFTTDAAGNLLLPMDWQGILLGEHVPVGRLLRGSSAVPAFLDTPGPIQIPNSDFARSFSPEGGVLPPIFEPQSDPTATETLTLFGSADAPRTVLRIARRSPVFKECDGGPNTGIPCSQPADCAGGHCAAATCIAGDREGQSCGSDADCEGGECGRGLFDFTTRLTAKAGPILIPRFGPGICQSTGEPCSDDAECGSSRCVQYSLQVNDPVLLDSILESAEALVTFVPEAVEGRDLNGDGDTLDNVLLLTDRRTGRRRAIGEAGMPGRAATRVHQPPFSYPAAALDGDLVAFLEAAPLQGHADANADGDSFDTILRVFRRTETGAEDLTAGNNLAIDAAPLVNGQSLAVANGLVYFRTPEPANARRKVFCASVSDTGEQANSRAVHPALSADGKHVAFESDATNLDRSAPPETMLTYVRDLDTERTTRIELAPENYIATPPVLQPSLSRDGRMVAVSAPDDEGQMQVWGVDRDPDGDGIFDGPTRTTAVSVEERSTLLGDGDSVYPVLSPDARAISFNSDAHALSADGGNQRANTFRVVRDPRGTGELDAIRSVSSATSNKDGGYGTDPSVIQLAPISDDGMAGSLRLPTTRPTSSPAIRTGSV